MADQPGQLHETPSDERSSARRVLRARRLREPRKRARWGLLGAAIAIPLVIAALVLRPARTPAEIAPPPADRAALSPASMAQTLVPAEPAMGPAEIPGMSQGPATDPAQDPVLQELGDWLRFRAVPDASALSVVNATAGGPFDIRAGDLIVDVCDRPGAESAVEISAALADGGVKCFSIRRGDRLVRATRRATAEGIEGPNL